MHRCQRAAKPSKAWHALTLQEHRTCRLDCVCGNGNGVACRQVEKVKKQFGGHEIVGKTLGVIGLGNIGAAVAESGQSTHVGGD